MDEQLIIQELIIKWCFVILAIAIVAAAVEFWKGFKITKEFKYLTTTKKHYCKIYRGNAITIGYKTKDEIAQLCRTGAFVELITEDEFAHLEK